MYTYQAMQEAFTQELTKRLKNIKTPTQNILDKTQYIKAFEKEFGTHNAYATCTIYSNAVEISISYQINVRERETMKLRIYLNGNISKYVRDRHGNNWSNDYQSTEVKNELQRILKPILIYDTP